MPSTPRAPASVVIVSDNPETLDGLQQYLTTAGLLCYSTRILKDPRLTSPGAATAVVVFPDDFSEAEVRELLCVLGRRRRRPVTILVTREPARLLSSFRSDAQIRAPIVFPRPAFGWVILDAIHAHAAESSTL